MISLINILLAVSRFKYNKYFEVLGIIKSENINLTILPSIPVQYSHKKEFSPLTYAWVHILNDNVFHNYRDIIYADNLCEHILKVELLRKLFSKNCSLIHV